jgi:hypothetical protein
MKTTHEKSKSDSGLARFARSAGQAIMHTFNGLRTTPTTPLEGATYISESEKRQVATHLATILKDSTPRNPGTRTALLGRVKGGSTTRYLLGYPEGKSTVATSVSRIRPAADRGRVQVVTGYIDPETGLAMIQTTLCDEVNDAANSPYGDTKFVETADSRNNPDSQPRLMHQADLGAFRPQVLAQQTDWGQGVDPEFYV